MMRKFILGFVILFASASPVLAQNSDTAGIVIDSAARSSTMDLLIGKAWHMQMPNGYVRQKDFNCFNREQSIISFIGDKKERITANRDFYLSNEIESVFDFSKVGKADNGKYIIELNNFRGTSRFFLNVYEILELTEDKLVIKESTRKGRKPITYVNVTDSPFKAQIDSICHQDSSVVAESSVMDMLVGKNWRLQVQKTGYIKEHEYETYDEFKWVIAMLDKNNNRIYGEREYYLSDKVDKKFDFSKVGKSKNGRYIIENGNIRNTDKFFLETFEIIELTKNKLVLKNAGKKKGEIRTYVCVDHYFKD